ncbi:dienelactone hydrolase family protein [Methylomonas sp. HW2-6]|uniref:dienelactone hydrolase family protein n=1 Tax=Methylomonas sp. HW2-6 TaxID=3376687 RepID=UPI0040417B1D
MSKFRDALFAGILLSSAFSGVQAHDAANCAAQSRPKIEFVEIQSEKLAFNPGVPGGVVSQGALTVKAKLSLPGKRHCRGKHAGLPAVVILHGSAGVDARGDFYASELQQAGIATLELDMWEARGVASAANRPALPILTYPDAFAALEFLSNQAEIDPERIGVLGFSWGGVMTLASATEQVTQQYGGGRHFKAHVANYPLCYGYNNPRLPYFSFGSPNGNPLTGAPVLIQIGELDEYDESAAPCLALKAGLAADEQALVDVLSYPDATHAWDRLMVPIAITDNFSHLGRGGTVNMIPNVEQAYDAREKTVRFFKRKL